VENLWKTFEDFGIVLNFDQREKIQKHFDLLMKWNKVHNLTTIEDPKKIFLYHYVDSFLGLKLLTSPLTPLQQLERGNTTGANPSPLGGEGAARSAAGEVSEIYDLGSGAGFPGIMAAILWPEKDIFLVESSKKKASFLSLAAASLDLNRVNVLCQRVEQLENVEFAISRAAFSPENWKLLNPAMALGGRVAFWLSETQLSEIKPGWVLETQACYELEPGNKRQVAVFHVKLD